MSTVHLDRDPDRILIIKPSAIGDIVHALPALNLVRRRWPTAKVSWLVTPACADLLQGHPQIDELIIFERKRLARGGAARGRCGNCLRFCDRCEITDST